MGEDYIAHYGTPKQKWGHRNYQYPDGTYTELGKERRRVGTGERKPLLSEEEKRQRRESYYDKKEAIRKGDIIYASKHLSEFSNQELDDIVDRYYNNKRISDIASKIEGTDKSMTEKIAEKLKPIASIAESSATIARSIDTIHKSAYDIGNRGKDDGKKNYDKRKKDDNKKKEKKSSGGILKFLYHDHMQEKARRIDYQNDAKHTHYEMEKRFRKEDEEEERRKRKDA